jgi:hypothetical protein
LVSLNIGNDVAKFSVSYHFPKHRETISQNLVMALRNIGVHGIYVVCNEKGAGDFFGLEPTNKYKSDILLELVDKLDPDIVHAQYEHGLYGLNLDAPYGLNLGSYSHYLLVHHSYLQIVLV